jgi:hypothetical protein
MGDINRQRLPRHLIESLLARDQKFGCWQNDSRNHPGCATRVSTFTGINPSLFRRPVGSLSMLRGNRCWKVSILRAFIQ